MLPANSSQTSRPGVTPVQPGFLKRLGLVIGVVLLAGLGWKGWGIWHSGTRLQPQLAYDEPVSTDQAVVNPGYVGPQKCAECHQGRVEECLSSPHFRTCRIPQEGELPETFTPESGAYMARSAGVQFEMRQIGNRFYQWSRYETAQGPKQSKTSIDLVLGAGKADDVYLSWREDGGLFELPVAWLWPTREWASSHFCNPFGEGDFSRDMTVRCMECHTTWMEHAPGTNLFRRDEALLGVTCERCHGPGRDHVEYHRLNPGKSAEKILNPISLDRELLIEVCTQCHSNAITHRQPPYSHRPGTPLAESYRTHKIAHPENDHVADQITRLRESRCFQQDDSLTCITCHDPHQRETSAPASAACAKCHQPADCEQLVSVPEPLQSKCVDCHMPKRLKINVKFEVAGDNFVPPIRRSQHQIGIDTVARDEVLWNWHRSQAGPESEAETSRLAERLIGHWLSEAEARAGEKRYMAAIAAVREALTIGETPRAREMLAQLVEAQEVLYLEWGRALDQIRRNRPEDAQKTLEKLLTIDPNNADYHAKLGTVLVIRGKPQEAIPHLVRVAELDPNNASGLGILGRIAYNNQKYEAALEQWEQASEIEPMLPQLQYDIGLALLELRRSEEAVRRLERAASMDSDRPDVFIALAEALAATGDWDRAIATGIQAGGLTEGGDPEQSQKISLWVEALKERATEAQSSKRSTR
jgi:tetratricopeptide (TPR) repeat protein